MKEFWTPEEIAEKTKLDASTIRQHTRAGTLNAHRIESKILIHVEDLRTYLGEEFFASKIIDDSLPPRYYWPGFAPGSEECAGTAPDGDRKMLP